jgi:ubiquinone biosynthesis protein COQ4
MHLVQTVVHTAGVTASRLSDSVLAIVYFLIMMVRPSRRSHYGQQFLYKTEGGTFERSFAAFGAIDEGRRLLNRRPDSVAMLRDRARLRALPPGSLGRNYLDFMTAGEIDEDLYLDGAIEAGQRFERDPGRAWFRTRVEAGHDMRHVLTDYGIDPLGETCLMAFRFGQTRHTGTFIIAAMGYLVLAFRREPRLTPAMREAYRRGRAARLVDLLPWEVALEKPLVELQREFGIEKPRYYWADAGAVRVEAAPIDICRTFGPLALMHAALGREGLGMPCGVVACFAGKSERELESAIETVRHRFPVLQTRLEWQQGRPLLMPGTGANRDRSPQPLLSFSSESGNVWRYRLIQEGRNTWLQAIWMHSAADGLSMLRFVQEVATLADGVTFAPAPQTPRQPSDQQPFLAWLPTLFLDQRYNYVRLRQPATEIPQVSWVSATVADRERVMQLARTAHEGIAAWLAAAAAIAFADQQGQPGGDICLNVPIARDELARTNGFGFGLGSLRFPVRLGENPDMAGIAGAIGKRIHRLANRGWDRNLERLIGRNPARHARLVRMMLRRPANPNVTISWKGHHAGIGGDDGLRGVACFAAAPTLHISAHTDTGGLSLSVTSRQSVAERHALLLRIARLLGCQDDLAIRELNDLGAAQSDVDAGGSGQETAVA